MNIVSNLIFYCNNCDANRDKSTAAGPSSGLLNAKFTFKGTSPPIIFARIVRPMTVWHKQNFVADFLQAKCDFTPKTAVLCFEPPFGGLGATYDVHLRLIRFHISVNWTFFTKCYGWGATSEYRLKIGYFAPTVAGWPKILGSHAFHAAR